MNAVCLVVDRLHAGYLGCYGNTWIGTPQLNRLAAESFVFDQALTDAPRVEEWYESAWLGTHVLERQGRSGFARPSLAAMLSGAGIQTALVTDAEAVKGHRLAGDFADCIWLPCATRDTTAADIAGTYLADFFAAAADWLASAGKPFFLWLHTASLGLCWDAPLELRNRYAEADEPLPPEGTDVPCRLLDEEYDPDELLGVSRCYAGQVALLDLCVGGLLELIESGHLADTLLVLIAPRGLPLGEHRRIGAVDEALYSELVHVPWLMRFPDGLGALGRSQALVQPADLPATLLDWWNAAPADESWSGGLGRSLMPLVREEVEAIRDRAAVAGGLERALRTPAWYLRRPFPPQAESPLRPELYAKPDDRWEVNDVADRMGDVAESLDQTLTELETATREGRTNELRPLDASLVM